ncbi:hypothetical protein ATANTOWER_026335 [Ataeniobius toweri]|uniref:Protein kinase domain-containing protein n=2 Tax=Goodeidae TaxID=28758 RepID=A0ABU7BBA0_9TELE|nr:hypothetical protein [Ataeniobius toweri]
MENILLSDQGHIRLSDFGLSRRLNRGGRAFTVCGTIQYMGKVPQTEEKILAQSGCFPGLFVTCWLLF